MQHVMIGRGANIALILLYNRRKLLPTENVFAKVKSIAAALTGDASALFCFHR
jgi:hypothetical protein